MNRSVSTLGLSFALLGVVAWMAAAHPEGGSLFAAAAHADVRAVSPPAPSALPPAERIR